MLILFPAAKGMIVLLDVQETLFQDPTVVIQSNSIDVFDVRGATPAGHQRIGGRAAIFVAEHDTVLNCLLMILWEDLVPHQHRDIRKVADGIRAGQKDRNMFDHAPVGQVRCYARDLDVAHLEPGVGCGPAVIPLDHQTMSPGRNPPEKDPVSPRRRTVEHHNVLVVRAVEGDLG